MGSTVGQQPFLPGQVVLEEQKTMRGFLPTGGHLEIKCRMVISPRSMAALWLAGYEDQPEQAGEICVTEIFGKDVVPGESAEVGMGHKQIRDPNLVHDFAAPRLEIDVADFHTYAVDWDSEESVFRSTARRYVDAPATDVPHAADAGRVRLPGMVDRRRRLPGAGARRGLDPD